FLIILLGQTFSGVGSYCTSFALRIFVYRLTSSVRWYAWANLISELPGLVVQPIAGWAADHPQISRTLLITLSDVVAAGGALYLYLLTNCEQGNYEEPNLMPPKLTITKIYFLMALWGTCSSIQYPAFQAAVGMGLVAPRWREKASGLASLGDGVAQLLSPAASGALLAAWGLRAVVGLDLATCALAVLPVVAAPRRRRRRRRRRRGGAGGGGVAEGWRYLMKNRDLQLLLGVEAVRSFIGTFIFQLIPPMVLRISDSTALGYASSIAGSGMLIGSILVSIWGVPASRRKSIALWLMIAQGAIMQAAGTKMTVWIIAGTGFLYLFIEPIIDSCTLSLWQEALPPALEGRLFAARRQASRVALLLGMLLSGPLADAGFEPLLLADGQLAGSWVAAAMGTGEGRGTCLLFVLLGQVNALVAAGIL
ncbi:unnamed protein product, partial [Heterosigma akashiwo]